MFQPNVTVMASSQLLALTNHAAPALPALCSLASALFRRFFIYPAFLPLKNHGFHDPVCFRQAYKSASVPKTRLPAYPVEEMDILYVEKEPANKCRVLVCQFDYRLMARR